MLCIAANATETSLIRLQSYPLNCLKRNNIKAKVWDPNRQILEEVIQPLPKLRLNNMLIVTHLQAVCSQSTSGKKSIICWVLKYWAVCSFTLWLFPAVLKMDRKSLTELCWNWIWGYRDSSPQLIVPCLVVPGLGPPGLTIPGTVAPRLAFPGLIAPMWVIPGLAAPCWKVPKSIHQESLGVGI